MLLIIVVCSIYLKVCLLEPSTVLIQFELGAPHACFTVLTQKFPITVIWCPSPRLEYLFLGHYEFFFLDVSYFLRDTLTTCLFEKIYVFLHTLSLVCFDIEFLPQKVFTSIFFIILYLPRGDA